MISQEVFPNGLTLITESMPHLRSVAVGVWLRRGSRHERAERGGISHFIEHMVFKGTTNRSAERIASEVDSIGGHMDAFTAKEYASFHLKVLDEHVPIALDILADIVLHPLFDPDEMGKERKVIFEEINMVEDTPDDLVMELFTEAFWPDHPLGRPILGTKATLNSFEQSDLAGFFRDVYLPENLVIVAAGHLEHPQLVDLVGGHFGGFTGRRAPIEVQSPKAAANVVLRSKKELEQVHVCLGTPAYHQTHEDRYAAYILNTVLGGSMSSRLFQNVRERRGLAYSISSGITAYSDAGHLTVYAGTSRESVDEVLRLSVAEFRALMDQDLPEVELRRAKDHLKGSLMLSLENTGSRMSNLARQEIYFGRQFGIDEILGGIEKVTAADVRRVSRDIFRGSLALSVLGDLDGYRPRLEGLSAD
jgi:predicted Zn-dependent peptidase